MGGILPVVGKLLGSGILKRVIRSKFPDKISESEAAELEHELTMKMMSQSGDIILQESKSEDKFVSRARPALLWITYCIIIYNFVLVPISLQIGAACGATWIYSFTPLEFPPELWGLFKWGFLGYVTGRSFDKMKKW